MEWKKAVWREMLSYGGPEARRIHDAAFPHAPLEPGRNIRIRVEEEVSACCEKWRGACGLTAYKSREVSEGLATWLQRETVTGTAKFCPECGEPLQQHSELPQ